jgi:hypothetical protein
MAEIKKDDSAQLIIVPRAEPIQGSAQRIKR